MNDQPAVNSQLSLKTIMLVGFLISALLAVANQISPFVGWQVLAICMFTTGIGFAMLFLFGLASVSDPESPQVVASVADAMSAQAIVSLLTDAGLNATVTGAYTAGFQTEIASDVKVVVPMKEVERAKEVLAEAKRDAAE